MPRHLIKNMQMCAQFGGYQIQLNRKKSFLTTFQLQTRCAFFTSSAEKGEEKDEGGRSGGVFFQ